MTRLETMPEGAAAPRLARASGELRLAAAAGHRLSALRQQGCLKALLPRHDGPGLTAVVLNTSGGVTGGDRLRLGFEAAQGAHLTVTTQAAERLYAARPGETALVANTLRLSADARLDWLPQETLLFRDAALRRTLEIEMAGDARLLACEALVIGRPAMRETVSAASLVDRIRLTRGRTLEYADALRLEGDVAALLARPATGGGAGALATVLFAAPGADTCLPGLRALLPGSAGASLIRPGLILVRLLAPDAFLLRRTLIPALEYLREAPLPRCWRL